MKPNQIAETIDAERAQIASEIHDALLPLMFAACAALQRQLDECDKDPGQHQADTQRLRQALHWLQEAQQIGRRILTQTYPPQLAGNTWHSAARQTIEQLASATQTENAPHINWQVDLAAGSLSDAAAGACYRIVMEAVNNAIRHADASEITVAAARENSEVVVSITDNGSGFDPHQVPMDRFGIRSMKGRAQAVGGDLQLQSQPGGPTTIRLKVPASNQDV